MTLHQVCNVAGQDAGEAVALVVAVHASEEGIQIGLGSPCCGGCPIAKEQRLDILFNIHKQKRKHMTSVLSPH